LCLVANRKKKYFLRSNTLSKGKHPRQLIFSIDDKKGGRRLPEKTSGIQSAACSFSSCSFLREKKQKSAVVLAASRAARKERGKRKTGRSGVVRPFRPEKKKRGNRRSYIRVLEEKDRKEDGVPIGGRLLVSKKRGGDAASEFRRREKKNPKKEAVPLCHRLAQRKKGKERGTASRCFDGLQPQEKEGPERLRRGGQRPSLGCGPQTCSRERRKGGEGGNSSIRKKKSKRLSDAQALIYPFRRQREKEGSHLCRLLYV